MRVGTSLPVATTAEVWPVFVMGMGDAPSPRDKAAPTGEETSGSNCILKVLRKDASGNPIVKSDKSASVHVINKADLYDAGVMYQAKGRVWVQPWESNTRVALSITVEQLVPVETPAGAAGASMGNTDTDAADAAKPASKPTTASKAA